MEDRDIRSEAGLDDRPVILVCGDSGSLPTGVARVIRGICQPIVERGRFQVVQHGWHHIASATQPVNYRIVPVARHPSNPDLFTQEDKWGQQSFDKLVTNLRPDIVFVVADYTRVDHIRNSPHRNDWTYVHYIPVDTFPPNPHWAEVVKAPDLPVFYTDLARRWGEQAGVVGPYLPHGIEDAVYQLPSVAQREALRQKFFGIRPTDPTLLIGSVGRNQRRKRHDLLIEAFAHLRHGAYSLCGACGQLVTHTYRLPGGHFDPPEPNQCPHCLAKNTLEGGQPWPNAYLYLHTDPTEPGGDSMPLNKLCAIWQVDKEVKFNPQIDLRIGRGLSNEMMASFYHCMDIYAHTADGGGWELPPMEAAACGVPVVAVDAPAQNEWLRTLPGARLVKADPTYMRGEDGYRHFGRRDHLCQQLLTYLQDAELRETHGHQNARWAKDYTWAKISQAWEDLFVNLLNPKNKIDRWRILVEA